jgi:hypothetical protein
MLLFVGLCVTLSARHVPEGIILHFAQPLSFVFAVSTAITLAGMEVFLFRFDNSGSLKQVFLVSCHARPFVGSFCLLLCRLFAVRCV